MPRTIAQTLPDYGFLGQRASIIEVLRVGCENACSSTANATCRCYGTALTVHISSLKEISPEDAGIEINLSRGLRSTVKKRIKYANGILS